MKSLLAFLRTLVLPSGATSGQRIILDGVNGTIQFYSPAGNLVLQLDGAAQLRFFQDIAGGGLIGAHQVDDLLMVDPGALANTFEVLPTGTGVDARLWGRSLPRGKVDYAQNASNVGLSTTAGVYTAVVLGNTFTPGVARRYRLSFYGGNNLLAGGSGFATTDEWQGKFEVSVGGGAFVDVSGPRYITRAQVAQSMRYAVPSIVDSYLAADGQSLQFRFRASKTSGAGTVTSSMDAGAGSGPWALLVEDVGDT